MKISQQKVFFWRFVCVLLATLSITFFWREVEVVTVLLLIFAFLINLKSSKEEVYAYLVVAVLATLLESLANFTGAWSYSYSQILNFPIWLPLYWGMGGIVMKDVYFVIEEMSKK